MTALSKFLMLLALFLLASHANVFTSLSLGAGNHVRVNYLIQLQKPMSNPTNEQSHKPIPKPTKWMDLNADPTNLSQKKSWVAYSEPKQDAELPSKITDLTSNQMCGLCQDKKIRARFADKPGIEQEINHPIDPVNDIPKFGKCQHQSILTPVDCHMQPPWWIRMHTCAWQAHKVSHLPAYPSLLSAHYGGLNVWFNLLR